MAGFEDLNIHDKKTYVIGALVSSADTRAEFLRNPKEWIFNKIGIEVSEEQLNKIVTTVEECSRIMNNSGLLTRTDVAAGVAACVFHHESWTVG